MEVEDLISIISSGVVVPVLGSDFAKVKVDPQQADRRNRFSSSLTVLSEAKQKNEPAVLTLNQYLAIRMADKFNFNSLKDEELNLGLVFLKSKQPEDIKYQILHDEYVQLNAEKLLDSYQKLVAVKDFHFYINTGPDCFLLDAFAQFSDRQPQFVASQLLTGNNNNIVLKPPSEFEPIVFNIFGSITSSPYNDCAVTDENYIELIVKLQEESNTQKSAFNALFNAFKQKNLLMVGSSFPDWLMRFVIRLISAKRYTQSNQKLISDSNTLGKIEFSNFLQQYNGEMLTSQNNLFRSAEDFVDTLYNSVSGDQPPTMARYKEKVFISFISDDRNTARLVNKAFTEKGVPTFFDEKAIYAGTNFENVIKPEIQNCDFFLPVITTHSIQDRVDPVKYVYKEWSLANFRRQTRESGNETATFIKPYCIGDESVNMNVYKVYFEGIGMEKVAQPDEDSLRNMVEHFIQLNKLTPVSS